MRPARRHAGVLLFGVVTSWWVASPGWGRLTDTIVGDNGDAMWQLSIMRWTIDALHSFHVPWSPPMFFPTTGTYAYSDPMLTQAIVGLPVRALGASPALLSNVLLLVSFTAGVYFAWRLLRLVGIGDAIALAGAAAWGFSELRIATLPLFQLVTAAPLIPLVFELVLRALRRPTWARGLGAGAATAAAVLAALYYGPLLAVAVPIAVLVWFVVTRRRPTRQHAIAAAVAVVVTGAAVLPIALHYRHVQQRDALERAPEAVFSAGPSDLVAVAPHHSLPLLDKAANGERALFPGLLVVVALPAALVVWRRRRRVPASPELIALAAAGLGAYLLATGTHLHVFDVLGRVPGFSGIRAPVRFAVLGQLALVAVACAVVETAVTTITGRHAVVVATVALVAVSLVDAGSWLPTARVPDQARWSAVDVELRRLPHGPVVELPIMATAGVANPRIEAPRLYLAAVDGNPRVNGYSGYQPPGFPELAATLNRFPAPDSLAALRRIGVRYVVLRTEIAGDHGTDEVSMRRTYGTTDLGRLVVTDAQLAAIGAALPASVREVGTFGGAVLLEVVA